PALGVLDPPRLDPRPADVTTPAVVELAGVQMAYGAATVLDVPALGVNEGEVLAVIGPNGSGKSTLLRIAGLLERPTQGVVRFRGRPVDARSSLAERRRMATVFQRPLLADMTVAQNVALGLRFRGAGDDRGAGVAVLMAGRIAQLDETARVFHAPVSEEVARFIGVETLVTGRVIAREAGVTIVEVAGRKLEIAAAARVGEDVRIGLRPEDVTLLLATDVAPLSSARNYLTGTIVRVTPSTPAVRIVIDVGFPLVA